MISMLRAVYRTGSSCILPNPKDEDIVKIYDNECEMRESLRNHTDHSKDYHFSCIERYQNVFLGCYILPFMQLIEGEELDIIKNYNFLEHKAEYTELAKKYLDCFPHNHKQWYHIVIAYFMFKKGKMSLTKKEIEIAQETHDNGISEKMYNTLFEYFK